MGRNVPKYRTQIMTKAYSFEDLRRGIPVTKKCTFVNLSFQPPMNSIVRSAIENYIEHGVSDINPKADFILTADQCKLELATHLGCDVSTLAWTRDTTEGLNLFARSLPWDHGDNVLLLKSEHPNHAYCWQSLSQKGLEVRLLDIKDDEPATGEFFAQFADERTRCIAISAVMFHNGIRNNIASICKFAKEKGIEVVVDGTQEVGLNKINLVDLGVSAYCFGTHKGLSVPVGLGVMYLSRSVLKRLTGVPPIVGAGCVQNLRSDLLMDPNIEYYTDARKFEHLNKSLLQVGALHEYLKFLNLVGMDEVEEYLRSLSSSLRQKLKENGVPCIGEDNPEFRYTHSNVVPFKNPEWMAYLLNHGVITSQYRSGIRISFGLYNNEEDVERIVLVFAEGMKVLPVN